MSEPHQERARGPAARFGRLVVFLRWLVVPAWIVGAAAATMYLPSFADVPGGPFVQAIPKGAPGIEVQRMILKDFGFLPAVSRTVAVERDPDGLTAEQQTEVLLRAVRATVGDLEGVEGLLGALPVVNTFGLFPSSSESGTTAVTYLFFSPETSASQRTEAASVFLDRYGVGAAFTGVTGAIPAREAQAERIGGSLHTVELATVILVALVVGLTFRAVGAPLLVLGAAAITYLMAVRVVPLAAKTFGFAMPGELEPILVVLLVGIMTDYALFFLFAARRRLREGAGAVASAEGSAREVIPIVLTAGLTVAGGAATLLLARIEIFTRLGPGMAMAVIVAVIVAVTFIPAAISLFGAKLFWPRGVGDAERSGESFRRRSLRWTVKRPVGALVLLAGLALLGLAAWPLARTELAVNLISGLPESAEPARASRQAAAGFAEGVVGPVEVLVHGQDLTGERDALSELQRRLEDDEVVAGVLGPGDQPLPSELGLVLSPSEDAARYLVILNVDPYGARALDWVRDLRDRLPQLLDEVGLEDAEGGVTGDPALSATIVDVTRGDIFRVGAATLGVALLVLFIFLRALLAPVLLLAVNAAAVLSALGATSWLFQQVFGYGGLTFYVPLAVAVLLLSFGADYTIFIVGRIWEAGERKPLREAIVEEGSKASRAISVAGIALAFSFALLAIIPIGAFRMFAFAMFFGVLVDTFLVRSYMIPAILTLVGPKSGWPSRRLETGDPAREPAHAG